MMNIPYVNIGAQTKLLKKELLVAIEKVLDHGNFILGKEVQSFEETFATYCGVRFAVGVNSGTDALFLSLKALDIGQDDEIITAPNSFIATASVIVASGAKPVFVDVRSDYNIDPELIEQAITPRTRAIIPVHLTGRPADMDPIVKVAGKHGLYVIEDAAQAVGARYRNKKVGSLGDVGCFSLHPLKTLNACGDGGIITTNNEKIYERLVRLRNFGLVNRDETVMWGYNSRLDSLQAAILLIKLKWLDAWNDKRRKNAKEYNSLLQNVIEIPQPLPHEYCVYHTFVVQLEERAALQNYLQNNGIGTRVHYPIPIHLQKAAYSLGYKMGDFPVCERQSQKILSLPIYQELETEHIGYISDTIMKFYQRKS
ncbi:MAG: DegT/DnrJ/EryC1/StrS family aminotransferase [Negativicutes bacterium]|nr:DegT/DnrJ/EryC1/StrS family aminotransferase [Negativicutes bacterium]